MQYKLHRIASNSKGWTQPSPGRIGQKGVGEFVEQQGFGLEDWNFNFNLATNGQMLGYTVANPSERYSGSEFGLVLATYDKGGWRAAGYYNGATYHANALTPSAKSIAHMAIDIFELAAIGDTSREYTDITLAEIEQLITKYFRDFHWTVPQNRIVVFREPLPIPTEIFNPGKQRMKTPFNLSPENFQEIAKLGANINTGKDEQQEYEESEGERSVGLHQKIERNQKLIRDFKQGLSSLACTVCDSDFESVYGEHGRGFIECHHTKPVSQMRPGEKTKIRDLQAVCANCHRIIHKTKPMCTVEKMRNFVRQQKLRVR